MTPALCSAFVTQTAERLDNELSASPTDFSDDRRKWFRDRSAAIGVALVVGWLIFLWHESTGTAMQDEFLHTMISRSIWSDPRWLIDSWGRPVNTLIYAVPSLFGIFGVRLAAVLMSAGTVGLSLRLGKRVGLSNTVLIPLMFTGQQLFDRHAFLGLTQAPFMLGITLVSVLILENRNGAAALTAGCLPLIRSEGVLLTAGLALVFLRRRQWRELGLVAAPYLIYLASHWLLVGSGPASGLTDAKPTTFYGHGSWTTEINNLTHGVGLVILVLSACSLPVLLRRPRAAFVVFAYPISYFLAHVVISRFGLFAYGSLPVYLLPLTPAIAISSAVGLESVGRVLSRVLTTRSVPGGRAGRTARTAVVAVGCLALAGFALTRGLATKPWVRDYDAVAATKIVGAVRQVRPNVHQVIATHAYVQYDWGFAAAMEPRPGNDTAGDHPEGGASGGPPGRSLHLGRPLLTPRRGAHRGPP